MESTKIGYLPLYLELYDIKSPQNRATIDAFSAKIKSLLEAKGLDIIAAPVCRLKSEFEKAARLFEENDVSAVITLHLAYSPSLESAEMLAGLKVPIIILDTTPEYDFIPMGDQISFNHGIHGVQDMCNLLKRNNKEYYIEAGHYEKSDVLDRIADWTKAAGIAKCLKSVKVGLIGESFKGMGDFQVSHKQIKKDIGIDVVKEDAKILSDKIREITDEDVNNEIIVLEDKYGISKIDEEIFKKTVRLCLAVRKWIEDESLSAFTMNFLNFVKSAGVETVPFLEASIAMARGIGYAGEGDVLTASLAGALMSTYKDVTFTEMFCPDWKTDTIFLSHMGEINLDVIGGMPDFIEKPFPFTDVDNPITASGAMREGTAVLVNLAPYGNGDYGFILSKVEVMDLTYKALDKGAKVNAIRGWIKPSLKVADFLTGYSRLAGTHHAVLVYGDVLESLVKFGKIMGWKVEVL